jgi:hypothetical protein
VQSPFIAADGTPLLVRCAVLFVDLLGVRAMNEGGKAGQHLVRLERAVTRAYRDFLSPDAVWPSAFFSDTLVLASPVYEEGEEEEAVTELADQAALLQLDLIEQGFFVRGGLSLGEIHIHDGLVFGPALVQAHEIESRVAVVPRIVLSKAAEQAQPGDASFRLLRDGDGCAFIDYLGPLFYMFEDPAPSIAAHRDAVTDCLTEHRWNKRRWEKYRWVAEYHNHVAARLGSRELFIERDALTWHFAPFD